MNTWSKARFRVRLDQSLVTLMEDEGRWAIRNNPVEAEKTPDDSTYLSMQIPVRETEVGTHSLKGPPAGFMRHLGHDFRWRPDRIS
jgi:hypothetical protein